MADLPQSFAQSIGLSDEPPKAFEHLWKVTTKLKLRDLSPPFVTPLEADQVLQRGQVRFEDLPLKLFHSGGTSKHIFDCTTQVDKPDFLAIRGLMQQNNVADLPDPFKPIDIIPTPFKLGIYVIPCPTEPEEGFEKYMVIKHFAFEDKVRISDAKKLCSD